MRGVRRTPHCHRANVGSQCSHDRTLGQPFLKYCGGVCSDCGNKAGFDQSRNGGLGKDRDGNATIARRRHNHNAALVAPGRHRRSMQAATPTSEKLSEKSHAFANGGWMWWRAHECTQDG